MTGQPVSDPYGLPEPYGTGALEPPDEPAPKGKLCDGCSPIVEREK